eukprot:9091721-Alexandrium_andersonii.AAC.1
MSASLVGSEMCIRDRRLRRTPEALLGGPGSPPGEGAQEAAETALKPPVSYTHLTLPTICSV